MSPAAEPILDVRDFCVSYGKVEAVHRARLCAYPGQIVTVIGANGAGKTTLLAALMGSIPARGEVVYQGQDLAEVAAERRVAQGISLVPERRELFSEMNVEDNLILGAFHRYRSGERHFEEEMENVYRLFPRLKERRRQHAGTLSGGERQMLALGRALMARPRVLMLDEPSLGLAPRIVRDIFHIIADLRSTGVAILLVEQNARAALQVADYGYVLETGSIVLKGPSHELAENPRVEESYLGMSGGRGRAEVPAPVHEQNPALLGVGRAPDSAVICQEHK